MTDFLGFTVPQRVASRCDVPTTQPDLGLLLLTRRCLYMTVTVRSGRGLTKTATNAVSDMPH